MKMMSRIEHKTCGNDFAPLGLWFIFARTGHRAAPCAIDYAPLGLRGGNYPLRRFHPGQENIFSIPIMDIFSQTTYSPFQRGVIISLG